MISDRDLEEKLTDLTTLYLGLGDFSLSASLGVETGGYRRASTKVIGREAVARRMLWVPDGPALKRERCQRCGAHIVGEMRSRDERLEAEEKREP